jgi:hypothetical protein
VAAWIKALTGRGTFHGVGQPDVQWKLRALSHRAAEDEQPRGGGESSKRLGVRRELVLQSFEVKRAEHSPHEQDSQDEPEVAQPVGQERLFTGVRRRRLVVPKSNQEIAGDTDELPEHEHLEKII